MPLIRKHSLYRLAVIAWGLVTAGATILVISGNARPWVAPTALPVQGPLAFFGVVAGLWLAGAFVIGRFQRRSWRRTGRQANLTSEGGLFGYPDLVGNVDGRSVRASTEKRKTSGGGESGSTTVTYTIVEAALATPVDDGLVFSHADGEGVSALVDAPVSVETEIIGDVSVVGGSGGSGGLARDVATGRVEEALRQPSLMDSVHLGNTSDVILDAFPDMSGPITGRLADKIEDKFEEGITGDATAVATETRGPILDGAELARQVEAVVAVADAYEAATADRPRA